MEKSDPLKKNPRINSSVYSQPQFYLLTYIERERERERETVARFILFTLNLNFIYSLLFRERDSTKIEFVGRKKETLPRKLMEIVHTPPLALLPSSKCMRTRSVQIDFCLLLFSSFLILIQFWCYNLTIFMRTRLYFDYSFSFREIFRD